MRSPRERTRAHLERLRAVAAVAGVGLIAGAAFAEEPAGYEVVDMLPSPSRIYQPLLDIPPLDVPRADYGGELTRPPVWEWTVDLPGGRVNAATHVERSRPVVHDESVFVGSAAGHGLFVLSRRDGALLRTLGGGASVQSEAIVVGDGSVIFSDVAGTTWSYWMDGSMRWRHDGTSPVLTRATVDGQRVYVADVGDLVVCLDVATGNLVWQHRQRADLARAIELDLYAAAPPMLVGKELLLGSSDGTVVALEAETGEVMWEKEVGEGRYPDVVSAPVVVGTDVIASGYFKPLVAIDRESRNIRWRLESGAAATPTVAQVDGQDLLFHPGTDGVMRAVATLTGAEVWRWKSGNDGALTTPLFTPAGLLVASSDGGLWLVDPARGKTTWKYQPDVLLSGLASAPAVDGRQVLFVTNSGKLHSLVVPKHGGMLRLGKKGEVEEEED